MALPSLFRPAVDAGRHVEGGAEEEQEKAEGEEDGAEVEREESEGGRGDEGRWRMTETWR